jgi:hypothetical protein
MTYKLVILSPAQSGPYELSAANPALFHACDASLALAVDPRPLPSGRLIDIDTRSLRI